MNCYVDSSVILRNLLGVHPMFSDLNRFGKVGSSELLVIECHRVLDRYRLENILDDDRIADAKNRLQRIIEGMYLIEMSGAVKDMAKGAFPTIIGTLDAIHISSAVLWMRSENMKNLSIASHDRQMNLCATALGLNTIAD